jgi:UDPglucose 6-dehydrogenase
MAELSDVEPHILHAVERRNFQQKRLLPEKLTQVFGRDLQGITIGVWGLAFKPGTDDMREASSIVLIEDIIERGGTVKAYDPAALHIARSIFAEEWLQSGKLTLCEQQYDVLKDADALALVTEWKPFCYPVFTAMRNLMRRHVIFDGRNQYDPNAVQDAGFEYYGIGRQKIDVKRDQAKFAVES